MCLTEVKAALVSPSQQNIGKIMEKISQNNQSFGKSEVLSNSSAPTPNLL